VYDPQPSGGVSASYGNAQTLELEAIHIDEPPRTQIQSVQIERFKAIDHAAFSLASLNVLVGANNSGKSSIIQGLHFGIGLLQTMQLANKWPNAKSWPADDSISTSINPTELIYSPSENVSALAAGGTLLESIDSAMKFSFTLASGERPTVSVRKGRNRNILVAVESAAAAVKLASLEKPFTIFSPGLAGIAKAEQYLMGENGCNRLSHAS
jgi:AAA ATPase domain